MTIKELAKELGRSHQAIYKRLKTAGITLEELQEPGTGQLTEEGEKRLRSMYAQPVNRGGTVEGEASTPVQPVNSTSTKEVEKLQREVEALRNQVAEMQHRAELAEVKAAAAADERDFLRTQLDNSIKASALASVRRLTAPEEAQEMHPVEEEAPADTPTEDQGQPPQPRKGLQERLQAAWRILRGKPL